MADNQPPGPMWTLGLLSENRNGMQGLSARRPFHRQAAIEVWWSRDGSGAEIAARLRELANELEANDADR